MLCDNQTSKEKKKEWRRQFKDHEGHQVSFDKPDGLWLKLQSWGHPKASGMNPFLKESWENDFQLAEFWGHAPYPAELQGAELLPQWVHKAKHLTKLNSSGAL